MQLQNAPSKIPSQTLSLLVIAASLVKTLAVAVKAVDLLGKRGLKLVRRLPGMGAQGGMVLGGLGFEVTKEAKESGLCGVFSWAREGDLLVQMWDGEGVLGSYRLWTQGGKRYAAPKDSGLQTSGLVMADVVGLSMLRGGCEPDEVWVVEGEPDFYTMSLVAAARFLLTGKKVAVLGIVTGAWSQAIADKIPRSARVVLATDRDKAGESFAEQIRGTLPDAQDVVRWKGPHGDMDANDQWLKGFGGWRRIAEIMLADGDFSAEAIELLRPQANLLLEKANMGEFFPMPPAPTKEKECWQWRDARGWMVRESWARQTAQLSQIVNESKRKVGDDSERGWDIAHLVNFYAKKLEDVIGGAMLGGGTHGKYGWGARLFGLLKGLSGLEQLVRELSEEQRAICTPALSQIGFHAALESVRTAAREGARDKTTRKDRERFLDNAAKQSQQNPLSEAELFSKLTKTKNQQQPGRSKTQYKAQLQKAEAKYQAEEKQKRNRERDKSKRTHVEAGEAAKALKELRKLTFKDGVAYINERYLPENLLTEQVGDVWKTLTMKSPQGTGKTHAFKALVMMAKHLGWRTLILTHRQALAWQLAARLGATCYLEDSIKKSFSIQKGQALVMSVDSVSKRLLTHAGGAGMPDLVLIDESEQVTRHLFSKTIGDKLQTVADDLFDLLGGQSRVVCADADAGVLTKALLRWAGRGEGLIIENRWNGWGFNKSGTNTVRVLKDSTKKGCLQLIAQVVDEVANLKADEPPILVACTSCNQAETVADFIAKRLGYESYKAAREDKKVVYITGDTKDGDAEKSFLNQPDTELHQYRAVLHSPTLGTGFSLESDVTRVFMFGRAIEGVTGEDMVQLMTRGRNQRKPATLWLDQRQFKQMPRDLAQAKQLSDVLLDAHANAYEKAKVSIFVKDQFRARLADRAHGNGKEARLHALWLEVIAQIGKQGWNPRETTLETLRKRGANVVFVDGPEAVSAETERLIKLQAKDEQAEGIFSALPLDPDEDIERLRQICTKEAKYKVAHHDIKTRLRRPITIEDAQAEVKRNALSAGRKLAEVVVLFEGGDTADFRADAAQSKILAGVAAPDRNKGLAQSTRSLDILMLAGLEDLMNGFALEHELSIDAPLRLAMLRQFGHDHREELTALSLKPPKEDCAEHRQDAETLRWLIRILKRLGFQCERRRASGAAQRKGQKARSYWITVDSAHEAWRWAEVPLEEIREAAQRDKVAWGLPA